MAVDPVVLSIFGPPPDGIDLSETYTRFADGLAITLACIAGLSVLLRFASRYLQDAGLAADDYLIAFSLVFAIAACVEVVQATAAGAGMHVWALTSAQIVQATKRLLLLASFCAISVGATKASILLLYIRLFGLSNRIFKTHVYTGAFLSAAAAVGTVLVLICTCRPTSYFWNRYGSDDSNGSCADTGDALFAVGVINLCLDFYILSIPIPQILSLNMSSRKKVLLCGLLFFGLFACAAGAVRNFYLGRFSPSEEPDYTWGLQPSDIWLAVEAIAGIICACMVNLLPLYICLKDYIRSMIGSSRKGDTTRPTNLSATNENLKLPSYRESKLVLRPQREDEIRLTTFATTVIDRDSDDGAGHRDGIVVRSDITQVFHDADQSSFTLARTDALQQ